MCAQQALLFSFFHQSWRVLHSLLNSPVGAPVSIRIFEWDSEDCLIRISFVLCISSIVPVRNMTPPVRQKSLKKNSFLKKMKERGPFLKFYTIHEECRSEDSLNQQALMNYHSL